MTLVPLLLALLAGPAAPEAGDRRPADVAAIRADIEEIFSAYARRDRAAVRRLHAEAWRGFLRNSPGVIRGVDHYMREAEGALGSDAELSAHEIRDFDALFYGETALISYVAGIRWKSGGETFDDTLRIFDVYRRSAGHWSQVASHVAAAPEPRRDPQPRPGRLSPAAREKLLADRAAVWRAFFEADAARLSAALPDELVAINAGETEWQGRGAVLAASQAFQASGARLKHLAFPKTEIQLYGDVAILYTTWEYDIETDKGVESYAGRGTEVFVRRGDGWVNSGWHLDSGK
ncbi:MAG TPA: nuclear transport factor 2 family protein [Thermoanaerobaculia bacterium]|jgi:ketosteroid isomerase-like protein